MRCLWLIICAVTLAPAALPDTAVSAARLPKGFILAAHRGVVTENLKENSRASLEETIRRGYTHIEVDLRCTKDGQPVCCHDSDLQRSFGLAKDVTELTLAELRALIPEEDLPSFADFCSWCAGRINLMLDFKGCPEDLLETFVAHVKAAMAKHSLIEQALYIGNPSIIRCFLGQGRASWFATKGRTLRSTPPGDKHYVFNHPADVDADLVKQIHSAGLQIVVSINTLHYREGDPILQGRADVQRMLDLGVDGLQIDDEYDEVVFAHFRNAMAAPAK